LFSGRCSPAGVSHLGSHVRSTKNPSSECVRAREDVTCTVDQQHRRSVRGHHPKLFTMYRHLWNVGSFGLHVNRNQAPSLSYPFAAAVDLHRLVAYKYRRTQLLSNADFLAITTVELSLEAVMVVGATLICVLFRREANARSPDSRGWNPWALCIYVHDRDYCTHTASVMKSPSTVVEVTWTTHNKHFLVLIPTAVYHMFRRMSEETPSDHSVRAQGMRRSSRPRREFSPALGAAVRRCTHSSGCSSISTFQFFALPWNEIEAPFYRSCLNVRAGWGFVTAFGLLGLLCLVTQHAHMMDARWLPLAG